MDFVAGIFQKKSFKKANCGRWSENVDVTLPDSISSEEVEFEKMLSINVEVLEILVGRSIWGNKKLELSVSIKLLIESESSYFNKSMLKSPNKKCSVWAWNICWKWIYWSKCFHNGQPFQI